MKVGVVVVQGNIGESRCTYTRQMFLLYKAVLVKVGVLIPGRCCCCTRQYW